MLDCVSSQALQVYGLAGQRMKRFLCVYVLVSESKATKHYTGKSTTVAAARIVQSSNPGIETAVAFASQEKAPAFEKYLKTTRKRWKAPANGLSKLSGKVVKFHTSSVLAVQASTGDLDSFTKKACVDQVARSPCHCRSSRFAQKRFAKSISMSPLNAFLSLIPSPR